MKRLAAVALAVAAAACASRLALDELAPDKIALLHWSEEEARRRIELEKEIRDRGVRHRLGVARWEDLGAILGGGRKPGDAAWRFPGHLSLMDPRTREIEPIAAAPPGAQPLAWTPDRSRLLFASDRVAGRYELYEYLFERDEVRRVVLGDRAHPRAAYGPDRSLVFLGYRPTRDADPGLWLKTGGEAPRRLLNVFGDSIAWTPGGGELVIGARSLDPRVSGARAYRLLALEPRAGATPRELGPGRHPTFSPDGAWLVYSAPAQGGWRLQRMRPDGSGRAPVGKTMPSRNEQMPTVSPDGRHVAFVANENGVARLFVRRFDGTAGRLLLTDGAVSWPVW